MGGLWGHPVEAVWVPGSGLGAGSLRAHKGSQDHRKSRLFHVAISLRGAYHSALFR